MRTRSRTIACLAAAGVATAASAGTASATDVRGGGVTLGNAAPISAPLKATPSLPAGSATIATPAGTSNCVGGHLGLTVVGPNPAPSVPLVPTAFNLGTGGCTSATTALRVVRVQLDTPGTATAITGTPGPLGTGSITFTATRLRVNAVASGLPIVCTLAANNPTMTFTGSTANADSSLSFVAVGLRAVATSGPCLAFSPPGAQTTLTAQFAPMTAPIGVVTLD